MFSLTDISKLKVIVVGADWYGDWAKNFHAAFAHLGVSAEIIYNNSLPVSTNVLERGKRLLRRLSPVAIAAVKNWRQRLSERELLNKISSLSFPNGKIIVVFVWTPPSEKILSELKKMPSVKLVLWQGEPTVRDSSWEQKFDYFDEVFIVDDDWKWPLSEKNKKRVRLLPLASDEKVFRPLGFEVAEKYRSEVAFIGQYQPARAEIFSVLAGRDLKIYGYGWHKGFKEFPWLKEKYAGALSAAEANYVYNGAKVNIGSLVFDPFTPATPFTTTTARMFDIALAGGFQIAGYVALTERLFGNSVKMFRNKNELRSSVDYYLNHSKERKALAAKSRKIALNNHTYVCRAKEVLRICF